MQTILTSNRLDDDVKRKVNKTVMINEMKDSTLASAAVVDDFSFDKIIVSEKKQLALIKKIHD